jgi:hypothetical protein
MPPEAQPNIDLDTGRFASFIHAAATAITNQTTMDQLGRSTFNLQTPIGIVAFPELFPEQRVDEELKVRLHRGGLRNSTRCWGFLKINQPCR